MSWANAMSGWREAVSDEAEGLLLPLFFLDLELAVVTAAATAVDDLAAASSSSAEVSVLSMSMVGAIVCYYLSMAMEPLNWHHAGARGSERQRRHRSPPFDCSTLIISFDGQTHGVGYLIIYVRRTENTQVGNWEVQSRKLG